MKKNRLIALALLAAGAAHAHIVLDQAEAPAGSAYRAALRVGHGCAGSATTAIHVQLPAGLRGAKPQPKPGWTLAVKKAALVKPYESHGRRISEDVVEISWTAQGEANYLQNDWFDEFVLRGSLPEQAGPLWFKITQRCVKGETAWAEIPAEGSDIRGLKAPAALLQVLPADPHAGHQH
jgi:uncharacterized protein YcnI